MDWQPRFWLPHLDLPMAGKSGQHRPSSQGPRIGCYPCIELERNLEAKSGDNEPSNRREDRHIGGRCKTFTADLPDEAPKSTRRQRRHRCPSIIELGFHLEIPMLPPSSEGIMEAITAISSRHVQGVHPSAVIRSAEKDGSVWDQVVLGFCSRGCLVASLNLEETRSDRHHLESGGWPLLRCSHVIL